MRAGFRETWFERGWLMRAVRLLCSWWRADRVRIHPDEGRLLRLALPCIIRIGGRYGQVVRRRTGQTPAGPYIAYHCEIEGDPCELRVQPIGKRGTVAVRWRERGAEREMDAQEIEVFGASRY